jgi:hypothetical protein
MKRIRTALTVFILVCVNLYGAIVIINPQEVRGEGSWENILSFSKTLEIQPGEEYYAYFDRDSGSIVEMPLPSLEAGLTQNAKDALGQVPSWLYEDLAKKLAELGDTNIDVGDFAIPTFGDMDGDGDLDLTVGSEAGHLYYFENVGTKSRAIFVMDEEIYLRLNTETLDDLNRTSPTVGDLDADGDNDIVVGISDGSFYCFMNDGSPNDPKFGYSRGHYSLLEDAHFPSLLDLDGDGDFDIAAGSTDGYINFFEYVGIDYFPDWDYSYRIYTGEDDDKPVYAADMDDDGDYDLTVGDGDFATLYFYRNIGSESQEIWAEDMTYYNGVSPEYGTAPAISDLNGDGRVDLVVGGFSGQLYLYKNSGSASNANWLIWSFYQVAEGVNYYPKEVMLNYRSDYHQDRYAQLILDADQIYKDEIAFSIAHMPIENLKALSQNQTQLFVDNAHLIYEIDKYLDYVDVIEKGDYTTTRYKFGEPGSTVDRELPRDIYYWHIVHPKVTNENVYYVHPDDTDSNHATDPSNGGRFWREYLFYHADAAYPPDNSGAPDDGVDDYPQDTASPLLKDALAGITSLWNGSRHFAPAGRPIDYGENAVVRVSNWVGWTLVLNQQEVSDSERPIQPVRIAHHHNGNCGELQDLSIPAARTALIPASGVLLLGEDHVWNEFYENGWHQWDNYWSHGGSVIDNVDNYWVGWGQRGGSGLYKHVGDDDTFEVTDRYIPEDDLNYVTIRVMDNNGDPVDGARVLVISYWLKVNIEGYQVEIPFPCIWNYTDSNGETLFKLATQTKANGNHNFTFKIISKVGSTESGKIELEHGEDYTFSFFLEGSAPNPELNADPQTNPNPPDPDYRIGTSYQVVSSFQKPRNLETGNYHPLEIPPYRVPVLPSEYHQGNHVDSFICDEQGFTNYMKGYDFDSYELAENTNSNSLEFDLPDAGNWYFVISNRDSIETTKVVELTLNLYYNVPPFQVEILAPAKGANLNIGDIIAISGIVTNASDLISLELSTDGGFTWESVSVTDIHWEHFWNTGSKSPGSYAIEVKATFSSNEDTDSINIELVDSKAPQIVIDTPFDYSSFEIGQTLHISGTVIDNVQVSSLSLSYDDGSTWVDLFPSLLGYHWSYKWSTSGFDPGGYVIQIKSSDGINEGQNSVYVELTDTTPPAASISVPLSGSQINVGSVITISGEALDNRGVSSLLLSLDSGGHSTNIISNLNGTQWTYSWDTEGLSLGWRTLIINASDGTHHSMDSIDIELEDLSAPEISFTSPSADITFNIGSKISIHGTARDNVEIKDLRIRAGSGNWIDISSQLNGDSWSYVWDTAGYPVGSYTIRVKASDGFFDETESLRVELGDYQVPTLDISNPTQDEEYGCSELIQITGWVSDNTEITELQFSVEEDIWVDLMPNLDNGNWMYIWDTAGLPGDMYTITVKASDGTNPPIYETVQIGLVDTGEPELEITNPLMIFKYDVGEFILIEGKVSDDVGVSSVHISTDNGITWVDISDDLDKKGRWSYFWDTSDLKSDQYTVRIRVSDGTNEVQESLNFEIEEKKNEDEGVLSFPMLILLIVIFLIIVLVTVGIVTVRRRNKKK